MTSARDALARTKMNLFDRWVGGAELSARDRIKSQVIIPMGRQTFTSKPDSTFFAMGSCFARNVEERLELSGANVLSRKMKVQDLGGTSGRALGMYNKYTPFSILQELQFASGELQFSKDSLLPASGDLYYDAQLRVNSGDASIDKLTARRAEINAAFSQAFQADILILTLGLTESWFDTKTNLYLNEMPALRLINNDPNRFEFRCLSIDDCRKALQEIWDVLKRNSKIEQKTIVTVSPVALTRTFSEHDVVIANTTSKSTLRVTALEFSEKYEGVDYFPSYEAVTLSAPSLAWQDDRLHASDFIVGRIIDTFLVRYGLIEEIAGKADVEMLTAEEVLITRLRRDIDKYKNQLIQIETRNK